MAKQLVRAVMMRRDRKILSRSTTWTRAYAWVYMGGDFRPKGLAIIEGVLQHPKKARGLDLKRAKAAARLLGL